MTWFPEKVCLHCICGYVRCGYGRVRLYSVNVMAAPPYTLSPEYDSGQPICCLSLPAVNTVYS